MLSDVMWLQIVEESSGMERMVLEKETENRKGCGGEVGVGVYLFGHLLR